MKKKKGFLSKILEKKTTESTESTEKPSTLPPPPPKKPNIKDIEDGNVSKVIEQFDFERARSIMVLTARDIDHVPTIDELKKTAKRLLLMCLEHQDREFWWAGGMHHGGICATYDNKWGLSLLYIEGVSRVKINDVRG